ncbi:uridine kinase (plasmid) [Streptomyces sp. DSM 116496]|uniref:uridine kinase family protein n=1 Tax=Streptomyces stoeckheimensis TaxID=3344656 RepID=UPI0038B28C7C
MDRHGLMGASKLGGSTKRDSRIPHLKPQLLLIGGGAGSGKTVLARALAEAVPNAALVHLDLCYYSDPDVAPSVPRFDGPGRVVDFSDPLALDPARIRAALAEHADAALVIVEGTFALALPELTAIATVAAFVDTPADIRVVRKTLRKIREGKDPAPGLLGHGTSRVSHTRHVAPTREHADIVLDGTRPPAELVAELRAQLTDPREGGLGHGSGAAG